MLLRTPKILKVILDHNQFKQLRNLIDSVLYAHQKQNSTQHETPVKKFFTFTQFSARKQNDLHDFNKCLTWLTVVIYFGHAVCASETEK